MNEIRDLTANLLTVVGHEVHYLQSITGDQFPPMLMMVHVWTFLIHSLSHFLQQEEWLMKPVLLQTFGFFVK